MRRVNNPDAAAVARVEEAKAAAVSTAAALRESQRAKREGGKRVAESDATTGAGGAATAAAALAAGSTGARRSPAKRAKVADTKVLWSPGKMAKDDTSLVAGSGGGKGGSVGVNSDGRNSSHSGQTGRNLPSLAASFRERYGEDFRMDEEEVDGKGEEAALHATARHGTGSNAMTLAETALSMSPTKMASEVQKARARAREQRFGNASKPPPAILGRAPSSGNAGIVAPAPRLPAGTASRPTVSAAIGRAANGGETANSAAAPMPSASRVVSIPTTTAPALAKIASAGLSAEPSTVATVPHGASDVLRVEGRSAPPSGSNNSVPSASPATMIPVVPPAVAEKKEDNLSAPRASAPAVVEVISLEDEDSLATGAAAPKRPIPDGGEVCVAQPPPKKMMSTKQRRGTSPGKVHNLRLRLRTDVPSTVPERTFDGGVEESKGFEPANPQPYADGGVEECKGFDPPNLPPTPRRTTPNASSVLPSSGGLPLDVAARPAVLQKPPTASTTSSASAASPASPTAASSGLPDVVEASGLSRQSSWGPSFGISDQAEDVPAVSTPGPVVPSGNPWVLSPSAPTFAKNRGRPLAESFSQPAVNTATSVGISGSAGARMSTREKASSRDEVTAPSRALGTSRIEKPSSAVGAQTMSGSGGGGGGGQQGRGLPSSGASHQLPAGQENIPLEPQRDVAMEPAGGEGGAGDSAGVDQDEEAAFTAEARPEEVALGVRVGGRALELLERLKREREESLDFDRKLTQALLDL